MNKYTIYKTSDGCIQRVVSCPPFLKKSQIATEAPSHPDFMNSGQTIEFEEEAIIDGGYSDIEFYVHLETGEVRERPDLPVTQDKTSIVADEIDTCLLSGLPTVCPNGLPIPTFVTLDATTYEVTDGEFEFTLDVPGTYTLKLEARNFKPKELTVTGT